MKRGPWVNMFLELHVACCLSLRGSSIAWSPLGHDTATGDPRHVPRTCPSAGIARCPVAEWLKSSAGSRRVRMFQCCTCRTKSNERQAGRRSLEEQHWQTLLFLGGLAGWA